MQAAKAVTNNVTSIAEAKPATAEPGTIPIEAPKARKKPERSPAHQAATLVTKIVKARAAIKAENERHAARIAELEQEAEAIRGAADTDVLAMASKLLGE